MRVLASSTISYQPTFNKPGFSSELHELEKNSVLIHADYSSIPPMDRRRMSDVLKMGIACSVSCLQQAGIQQPDAIVVGTSMGCCSHTKNFLDKIISSGDGPLSPTAFILSTHNTIAGQISLHLGNHAYNITHTQSSLSFEQALMDAMLCLQEGAEYVLVGGADEFEASLFNMEKRLHCEYIKNGYGASFFVLSKQGSISQSADVRLVDVGSYSLLDDSSGVVQSFLASNQVSTEDIGLILYSHSHAETLSNLQNIFDKERLLDYQKYSGTWFTNSAFAAAYGIDLLVNRGQEFAFSSEKKYILIYNNLLTEHLGLILLTRK
jgi:hypothetical protein